VSANGPSGATTRLIQDTGKPDNGTSTTTPVSDWAVVIIVCLDVPDLLTTVLTLTYGSHPGAMHVRPARAMVPPAGPNAGRTSPVPLVTARGIE